MANERSVPAGRIGRLARFAGLTARTGASLLLQKDAQRAARAAADVLGTMRGLAAKVGQMASYIDGVVPEEHRAAYEDALRTLRAAAPASPPEAIRRLVEEDLGAPIDRLFATWEDAPFASASIGEVHRATTHEGAEVAVKVQHPGIAKAVESDLANAAVLRQMASTFAPKNIDTKRVFHEVRSRFTEELDYRLEAERQTFFRTLHAGDPHIRIPEIVPDRCGPHVLTAHLARGTTLEEAAETSEADREKFARTLWRFVFKGNLVGGLFNADPHPGNYLFGEDGTITFLDFGCCQPIDGERLDAAIGMHVAAIDRDEQAFKRHAVRILETAGGTFEARATSYSRRCFEPLFGAPFHVTRGYVRELAEGIREMKNEVFAKDGSFRQLPPGMLFMNRLQFGFYSVLARLDVEADYADVERRFLVEAGKM